MRRPAREPADRRADAPSPAWERTLSELEKIFDESPTARAGLELVWRLDVSGDAQLGFDVDVSPWIRRVGKKGRPGEPTRLGRLRLLLELGGKLSPEDARVASLLPEPGRPATRALLESLVDHPRLFLAQAPDVAARVERAPVGLVAEDRRGSVRLRAGIDGAPLPAPLLERLRRSRPEDPLFLWDGRTLTLLDFKVELKELLGVLHQGGDLFPPESHGALLQSLSRWAGRVPVAMPRTVLGESVASELSPLLRFALQSTGAVEVELRLRPLPESPALVPGQGPRDVHVRRGEKALHALRDLRAEEEMARALLAELPLSLAEVLPGPYHLGLESAEEALTLLEAAARRDPPPEIEWEGPPLRSLGARGPGALKVSLEQRHAWFGLLGGLHVEGERVELARLLDAARRRQRYVRVTTGTYVELGEALRRHLEVLADHARPSPRGLEVGPSAALALSSLAEDGAALEADVAFRQLAARAAAARALEPSLPEGLLAELRPYQVEGFRWLSRLASLGAGGVLADDMGLGKTVQALTLLLARQREGPALVVAPTSVAFNWKDEAARFAPSLRLSVYAELADREAALTSLGPGDVLVVSYGLLAKCASRLAGKHFSTIVFDEAQGLKNARSQRARAARALAADFKLALSGTPLENHLGELWSLFASVFPALLGPWESFRLRYAAPIERRVDPAAAPALARVLAPFLLRRTKSEVLSELPPRVDVRVPVVLSAGEWQLYEDARLAALSELETRKSKMREEERRVEVLAALTRLRLAACHPGLYDPRSTLSSSKLARLVELALELRAEGERALVFSQFTSHLARAREALSAAGVSCTYLDGETPAAERAERVRAFQAGTSDAFLISLRAGGFGLNLTAASSVILLDPWWNPAVEDQAADRAHRIGQTRPVTVYRLVSMGTIEERMLALHAKKRALVDEVLSGTAGAGRVNTDELLALLSGRL